jgi:hypothetical protein
MTRHCSSGKFIKTGGATKGYKKEMMMMFSASSNFLDHEAKKNTKLKKATIFLFCFRGEKMLTSILIKEQVKTEKREM